MVAENDAIIDGEGEPSEGLSDTEAESVAERKAGSAKVVHEVIRLQGDEELIGRSCRSSFQGLLPALRCRSRSWRKHS